MRAVNRTMQKRKKHYGRDIDVARAGVEHETMQTVYDWVAVLCFSGLIVLFLQRSMAPEPKDRMIVYLPPALGCALFNYLGNAGYVLLAVAVLVAAIAYSFVVLKPFAR